MLTRRALTLAHNHALPTAQGWNVVESAKWTSWSNLGDMPSVEAMRLYVRTLDEAVPDWSSRPAPVAAASAPSAAASASSGGRSGPAPISLTAGTARVEKWTKVTTSGRAPAGRYLHAAAVVGTGLFVVGGSRNGRKLGDVAWLDLPSLTWTRMSSVKAVTAAAAVAWRGSMYLIGGTCSDDASDECAVRRINPASGDCEIINVAGEDPPVARTGHAAVLVGDKSVVLFGGEGVKGRLLNDVHVLDLETMTWSMPEVQAESFGEPAPRSEAVMCYHDGAVYTYGGGSRAEIFGDLWRLDVSTWEWTRPAPGGEEPEPRAGHAGVVVDGVWHLEGGGGSEGACGGGAALNLRSMEWVAAPEGEMPVGEGLAMAVAPPGALPQGGPAILSFGGYDGHYSSDLYMAHIDGASMTPLPSPAAAVAVPAKAPQAAAAPAAAAARPVAAVDQAAVAVPELAPVASVPANSDERSVAATATGNGYGSAGSKIATATQGELEAVKAELVKTRAALDAERQRAFQLEVQVAELNERLAAAETEAAELRMVKPDPAGVEDDAPTPGGIWGYISGQT